MKSSEINPYCPHLPFLTIKNNYTDKYLSCYLSIIIRGEKMAKRTKRKTSKKNICKDKFQCNTTGGAIYGLGFIGAAAYYISTAPNFWAGALGVLKAIVWPAFLVFGLLKQIGL